MAIMRGRNPTGWGKSEISRGKQAKETRLDGGKVESVGRNERKNPDRKRKKRNQSGKAGGRNPTGWGKSEISRAKRAEEPRLKAKKVESVG